MPWTALPACGQYCWQDPAGKKHYKLRTHHLKALVKYAEQGGIIETHNDIPNDVRDQLYAEEHHWLSRQNKAFSSMPNGSMLPQINIHVLPSQSSQYLVSTSWKTEAITNTTQDDLSHIAGSVVIVEEYTNWHLSRVSTDSYKENFIKARDIALENCFGLEQIRSENPEIFCQTGSEAWSRTNVCWSDFALGEGEVADVL